MTTSIHERRLASRVARTAARFVELAGRRDLTVADLPDAKLPWYGLRNAAAEGEPATVFIFDEIGGSFGVDAKQFVQELEAITAPVIQVRINSPGGALFDAIAIYNALNHHPARIVVYVDSLAASAASVIAMAGDEVVMMPGSQLMIHDASAVQDGNAGEMSRMATFLDRQSDNVADLYRLRGGGDLAQWRDLMLAETWMFAQEAVDFGLADRVDDAGRGGRDDEFAEAMARSFDLGQFRYAGRREAPAPSRHRTTTASSAGNGRREDAPRPPRVLQSDRGPVVGVRRHASTQQRRDAARSRADGAQQAGYRTQFDRRTDAIAPAGKARSLPFPARLRAKLETRNGREFYHLVGQASVFNTRYEMWDDFGPYEEEIDQHAADVTLAADPDVAFLVNHRGVTMARTTEFAGRTLQLAASTGLDVDAWLNPQRQDVSGILIPAIEDGNITEMSFAFMLEEGWWSADFTVFRIMRFDLHRGDVSAVNYGANPYTSIVARQREVLDDLDAMPAGLGRAAVTRLLDRPDLDLDDLFNRYAADRDAGARSAPARAGSPDPATRGRTITHVEALLLDT